MNALDASLSGIRVAERSLDASASRIARASSPDADVDLASEVVNLDQAKTQVAASVAVARTASETLGTLIDTFA